MSFTIFSLYSVRNVGRISEDYRVIFWRRSGHVAVRVYFSAEVEESVDVGCRTIEEWLDFSHIFGEIQ